MGDTLMFNKESTARFTHTIPFSPATTPTDVEFQLSATEVYVLIFSNCGGVSQATVSGSVVVQNPYGFLPGNEYRKMTFHGWLAVAWLVVGVIWLGLSLSHGWSDVS